MLTFLALLCGGCGSGDAFDAHVQEILDGSLDREDPAVLMVRMPDGGTCTGSAVGARLVLTALHCVADRDPGDLELWAGADPLGGDGTLVADTGQVVEIRIPDVPLVDVAVLVTARDLGLAPLVRTDDPLAPRPGDTVRVVGYGRATDETADDRKREGWAVVDHRDDELIYATPVTCFGDSGAPVLDDRGLLVGVVSAGTDARCSAGLDVYEPASEADRLLARGEPGAACAVSAGARPGRCVVLIVLLGPAALVARRRRPSY